jgi:hypothetical protein
LKATALPTILHRISQLLVAEDLRVKIATEAFSNKNMIIHNQEWDDIKIEHTQFSEINCNITYEDQFLEDPINFDSISIQRPHLEIDCKFCKILGICFVFVLL